VRHIPEDELHAYLDQALSRSQAIEIERHLARCPSCQARRDGAAALRDRTTALLARLGSPPSLIVAPPYAELKARHLAGQARRRVWIRSAAVAAGIAGLGIGWAALGGNPAAQAALEPPAATPTVAVAPPPAPPAPATETVVTQQPARPRPAPAPSGREARLVRASAPAGDSSFRVASAVETDPASFFAGATRAPSDSPAAAAPVTLEEVDVKALPVTSEPGLAGLWRTLPVDHASKATSELPIVPGLTVVGVRMQPGATGAEVVAVDQQLESGDIVRTIMGPATRVGELVARDAATDSTTGRVTFTIRQADRMVAVTGSPEAVSSLLSRVNGRRRY